jgi:hypothetical protein
VVGVLVVRVLVVRVLVVRVLVVTSGRVNARLAFLLAGPLHVARRVRTLRAGVPCGAVITPGATVGNVGL